MASCIPWPRGGSHPGEWSDPALQLPFGAWARLEVDEVVVVGCDAAKDGNRLRHVTRQLGDPDLVLGREREERRMARSQRLRRDPHEVPALKHEVATGILDVVPLGLRETGTRGLSRGAVFLGNHLKSPFPLQGSA